MRRFRTQKATVGVSLFPFLAVLICTMGALIVLLVLVVQMARVNASEDVHETELLAQPDALQTAKEDLVWRQELLEQQRVKMLEETGNKRLELSHLEEHIRELERQWEQLQQAAADLQMRLNDEEVDQQGAAEQLQRLQASIRETDAKLNEARTRAANRPPMYAIVPYDGPNGTHRRPIYVECRSDSVVIQPEGIRFPMSDFHGPLGPGNPLDAALRAIREYYARIRSDGSQGEPYPLLIVRPDGVESYAMARSAMRNWDDEFGYELVDESMQLKYPEADPALARLLQKAASDARSRQAVLAAAMPSKFGREQEVGFVASPSRGGFIRQGGAGNRTGGFGQGGDSRHIDGLATGRVPGGAPPAGDQSVGGMAQQGHSQGKPGASMGNGCSPLANKRGRNWGLPGASANATGVIRSIRLAVLRDRLIILPELGERRAPEMVLVEGAMVDEIDEFVAKVWDRIEGWGMAVAGGYWKPILRVNVGQGAEERFQELQTLLQGSGLEVQRSDQ